MTALNERKKIAMLRSNPKDATFGKIPLHLAQDYSIECYVWDRQGDYAPVAEHAAITYQKCEIRAGFHTSKTFLKLLGFEAWLFFKLLFARYDCIHAIDLDTGLVGLIIAKLRFKPFIYHCIDPYYVALPSSWLSSLGGLAKQIENYVITKADLFIITDLLRMPQHEGARPKRVIEIANVPHLGVSPGRKRDGSLFITGYIGSLIEGRNLRTIIEAVGELGDGGIKLIMGGFGPLEADLRALCGRYRNVEFIGWVPYPKVLDLEQTFDVMIHITNRNNLGQKWVSPNKLFESMAFGKPIIVGEGTLAADRVALVDNGIVIPYGSKEKLQEAILHLKDHPDVRKSMGERGLKEFGENWSYDVMGNRLRDAYQALLKAGK